MSMKKEIFNKLTGKFILLTILLTLLSINVLAANDPGHDTLYIEQQGDSELNGTLNITSNVSVEGGRTYEGGGLTIYGNGYAETPVEAYISGTTGSHLYLDGQGNIYIKYYGGDTVYVGRTDITATDLNVSGALYTRNQAVCLANGTNCPSSLGGANITAGGATPGYIPQFQSTTVLNNSIIIQTATGIGIGTTSPTTKLDVNGSINISLSTGILYAPQICLAGTCQTNWPSGADGNNYTTGVNVSGTSTKNISLTIIGRDPVWITFTDIDTDTWITDKVGIQTDISSRMLNETVYTLVGARMMNGSLDLSLQGMNTTIGLKAATTTVDATNTAQNNTLLLQVGARMMNGSLDLSLQGMNTTIGLKAATTVVDATNTAQNNTILLVNGSRSGTGNCPEGQYIQNLTNSTPQCAAPSGSGDITEVQGDNIYIWNGSTNGIVNLIFNETKLNNTINLRAAAYNETNLINSVNTSSNIQVLGFFNTTVIDATNLAQNNTLLSEVGARAMNATVMTLVGARMMNGSLDLSLQGMNTTIALKASTTTVDATNTAQNNTILLEVGARAMNATLMSEVGARMVNGSLDLSLQGMNTTIGLKALTTVVDATNTAQNNTMTNINATANLKALTTVVDATNTAQNNSITNVNATANLKALPGTCTGQTALQTTTTSTTGTCIGFGTSNSTLLWIKFNSSGLLGNNISTYGSVDLNYTLLNLYYNQTSLVNSIGNWSADKTGIQSNITNVNSTANLKASTTVVDATNTAQNNSLTNVNATANLKASTTVVDATNTAQNNTILLEVGARAMNATVNTLVGGRILNGTLLGAGNISAGTFGNTGTFTFPANISVSENITAVKCIIFSNGGRVGNCG